MAKNKVSVIGTDMRPQLGNGAHAPPRNRALETLGNELRGRTVPSKKFLQMLRRVGVDVIREDSGHYVVKDVQDKDNPAQRTARVPKGRDMNPIATGNVIRQLTSTQ